MIELTPGLASRFARTALGHVGQEYPNKLDHVMAGPGDVQSPRELHPIFYGSFDWHSCVHSWWTLLRLRRLYPELPEAPAITALANKTITTEAAKAELAYARRPESRGFERPYGWVWLLQLHLEASRDGGSAWAARLEPLARHFADGFRDYLGKLTYPITTGTHFNTAFALALALDWAEAFDPQLHDRIASYAREKFGHLPEYRGWEPGGDEFLSPVLSGALLMSKILPEEEFTPWFSRVLPEGGWLETACRPVSVSDPSDGKMAHLDGLNFSRAWALRAMAKRLPQSPRSQAMRDLATDHIVASIEAVDGDYMGSHWLASFALLALQEE